MPTTRETASHPDWVVKAWTAAFNRSDLKSICALYDSRALLWGTTAQSVISNPSGIAAYFQAVFDIQPAPQVQVTECLAREHDGFAILAGAYDLELSVAGQRQVQPARFTFTLRRTEEGWLIVEHHSSRLPTEPLVPNAGAEGGA